MKPFIAAFVFSTCIVAVEPMSITGQGVSITVDPATQGLVLADGSGRVFAKVRLRGMVATVAQEVARSTAFAEGRGLLVTYADGSSDRITAHPDLPFALVQPRFVNRSDQAVTINRVPTLSLDLDLGAGETSTFGTGGLMPLEEKPVSYAWLAVVHPAARDGVVAGWLTHERASGVLSASGTKDHPVVEGRTEYGHLTLAPGTQAEGEILAVGRFADARIGLEQWASAVARHQGIRLNPQPVVYCTWYDNVHGRAGDEVSLKELTAFADKELKPYGFTCVQIDDGWQLGDNKGNGPRKNFSGFDPKGPYKSGMQPTAGDIAARGLTPGVWLLPFGGTWNDPFFAEHQDWFVKRQADGKPFDTAWGGTCLDMTHPGARAFVAGEVRQIVHDWGYRYLKIDGISTGCGVRPQYINAGWKDDDLGDGVFADRSATNLDAFRSGLRLVRESAGADTFILGCCASQNMRSYAGSFGLVDAMRTGPDNNGSWDGWFRSSPLFGTRHHHLHGRIWYNDPDPIYVRPGLPLESARCIASWNAIAGHMVSLSDWLPTLPAERLDIIKRVIPSHHATARAADLFQAQPQRVWTVSQQKPGDERRDVVGLFNWGGKAEQQRIPVASLDLPPGQRFIAYDFWSNTFLPPFDGELSVLVPSHGCRILAVRPMLPRPFLLSTSRHVTQGILEVSGEAWDGATRTLSGVSDMVAGDDYELRVVARDGDRAWPVESVSVSPADLAAGVTVSSASEAGLVRVAIRSPVGRAVTWTVRCGEPVVLPTAPPAAPGNPRWKPGTDQETIEWTWDRRDGQVIELARDGGATQVVTADRHEVNALEPERTYRFRCTAIDWSGRRGPTVEQEVTMPKGKAMAGALPLPTVPIATLRPLRSSTARGSVVANMSNNGGPIQILGESHATGVGVCAPSTLAYTVKPEWGRFVAVAGLDDEVKGSDACVIFRVVVEIGKKRHELAVSPKIRAGTAAPFWRFDVKLPKDAGVILLMAENGDGANDSNHVDWADAGFLPR